MKRIAILGSGTGTNAEKIIDHFAGSKDVRVELVMSNRAKAFILERCFKKGVKAVAFSTRQLNEGYVFDVLQEHKIDLIVLAGFLKLIPDKIIKGYHGRIINIHPALLPNFGGKDMYGDKVHEAVLNSGTIISGISVHHVNEHFDEGEIIFQAACHVSKDETPASLADKVHVLEHKYYPLVIEKLLINSQ